MHDHPIENGQRRPAEGRELATSAEVQQLERTYAPQNSLSYGMAQRDEDVPLAITLRQYLYMLLKRRSLILGTVVIFTVLGGIITFMRTPMYTATVRLQIERESAKIVEGGNTAPTETGTSDFLKTQFELLKSRGMAERVVSALHLSEETDFINTKDISLLGVLGSASNQANSTALARETAAVKLVSKNIAVLPVPGSRLVDLSYRDPGAPRAALIANSYADAYIEANIDKRFEANAYAKKFLDDQIKQLKIKLEKSQKTVLDFAERERIVEANDKASIAENNLATASAAAGQLISERIKNEQTWRQVADISAINLPQFLSNSVIEVLRGQRKALETEYQEKLESFEPSYPAMVQIQNKIREIDKQLADEVMTIRSALKGAYKSSLTQENQMKEG